MIYIITDSGFHILFYFLPVQFGGGFDSEGNGILIEKIKNHKDWYSSIKKLINNPDVVKTLQDNLHATIKDTYSMNKVTEERRALYLDLIAKKQASESITKEETTNV